MANNFSSYWIEWLVSDVEDGLEAFDFKLVNKADDPKVCSMPLIWFEDLDKDRLNLFRTPQHKPSDPYELVGFIQYIERFLKEEK